MPVISFIFPPISLYNKPGLVKHKLRVMTVTLQQVLLFGAGIRQERLLCIRDGTRSPQYSRKWEMVLALWC